jgi:signal transduction histidine kinase
MKVVRLMIWLAGAALCAGMSLAVLPVDQPEVIKHRAIIDFSLAFVAITIGVIVWQRRPESLTGLLLTAFPFAELLGQGKWIFWNHAVPVTVAFAVSQLSVPLFAHLILSYPTGRLATRAERYLVSFAYVLALLYALPFLLFFDPLYPHQRYFRECFTGCAAPVTHVAWADVNWVKHVWDWLLLPLAVIFLVLLARKLARATPGGRRVVLPLSIAAVFAVAELFVHMAVNGTPDAPWTHTTWFWVSELIGLAVPLSLGLGVLLGRGARSAVADLVVELQRTPPGHVRDALARTLGDPELELALWLPERSSYVDSYGRAIELPASSPHRAVTVIGPAESPVAALLHDPALLERPGLLEASGAAARLALENEQLQAELRAQLGELRASRARIVTAGDAERRRLERDLHDGAQQRLLGLGLALQLVRSELGEQANGATELLDQAEAELGAAIEELRELARGIHPAVLTEQGLAPALRTLAARASLPVQIVTVPDMRFPGPVEAAAYFVVSEALVNVAKHAHAAAAAVSVVREDGVLSVTVRDDGVGGAGPSAQSGLAGLADRVQALNGRLTIDSEAGHGTTLTAELPCAVASAPIAVGAQTV